MPFNTFGVFSVGTTAVTISGTALMAEHEVRIVAAAANPATIYIGPSTVSKGDVDSTSGWELAAGERMTLSSPAFSRINLSDLYAIAASGSTGKVFILWR